MLEKILDMISKDCDILEIRLLLVEAVSQGMDKESIMNILDNALDNGLDEKTNDVIRDLMDFVVGWCNSDLQI